MLDAAMGGAMGLLVSQVLQTPDPVALIRRDAQALFTRLAAGFAASATALATGDTAAAHQAQVQFIAAQRAAATFADGIASVRSMARWTVRGRWAATQFERAAALYEQHAPELAAAGLCRKQPCYKRWQTATRQPRQRLATLPLTSLQHAAIWRMATCLPARFQMHQPTTERPQHGSHAR